MVAGTSAIGAASMSSTAPPSIETRAGGRCSAPVLRSFDPTKPSFQSSERPAAEADTRAGSGRRGGSTVTIPRQAQELAVGEVAAGLDLRRDRTRGLVRGQRVGRAEQEHVGAVGQHHERDDLARLGLLERARQQQAGMRGAGVADRRRKVVDDRVVASAETLRQGPDGSGVQSGDDDPVHLGRGERCRLQRRVPRLLAERHVLRLAEALLPDLGAPVTGRAPAVEELLGGRAAPEVLGDDRGLARVRVADEQRGGAVAPADSSGLVGRPVRRSEVTTSVVPAPSSATRSAPTPERTAPPRSSAAQSESRRSAAWIAVALVLSRYAGSAVENQSSSTCTPGAGAQGQAAPPRRPSSWCPRRRTPPTGCPCRRRSRRCARSRSAGGAGTARNRRR